MATPPATRDDAAFEAWAGIGGFYSAAGLELRRR
jgi:hypothetical protein